MAYKIAVGSSDGIDLDLKFGEVKKFIIFEVDKSDCRLQEIRIVKQADKAATEKRKCADTGCKSEGCSGSGHGCSGATDVMEKVKIVEDCRCIVCKNIGFQAQKQFERKAISVFDVECRVSDALEKIVAYYEKMDHSQHIVLRRYENFLRNKVQ